MIAAGSLRVEAVRDERFEDVVKLPRPGVADERAAEPRKACPVDVGRRAAFVFVPAHERHAVAAPRIGQRHAGITRRADCGRNARHDLERNAVLVQEQRFLAAAIEQERIAPLEPRDDFSLARFLHEQVVDRFLIERLRRCRAEVDLLGLLPRIPQQPRLHEMVVEHDVGSREIAGAAGADEPGIAGAGADEVDDGAHHVFFSSPRISAAPCFNSSSPTCAPKRGCLSSGTHLLIADDTRPVE